MRSAFEGQGVASGDAIMLQAVSTARDTQRQLSALRVQVVELTEQAKQLKLQEEIVVTRVRGEASLATTVMQEEAQVRWRAWLVDVGGHKFCRNGFWLLKRVLRLLRRI